MIWDRLTVLSVLADEIESRAGYKSWKNIFDQNENDKKKSSSCKVKDKLQIV